MTFLHPLLKNLMNQTVELDSIEHIVDVKIVKYYDLYKNLMQLMSENDFVILHYVDPKLRILVSFDEEHMQQSYEESYKLSVIQGQLIKLVYRDALYTVDGVKETLVKCRTQEQALLVRMMYGS